MRSLDSWMSRSACSRLLRVSAVWAATSSTVSAIADDARASSSVVAEASVTAALCSVVVAASSSDAADSSAAAELTCTPAAVIWRDQRLDGLHALVHRAPEVDDLDRPGRGDPGVEVTAFGAPGGRGQRLQRLRRRAGEQQGEHDGDHGRGDGELHGEHPLVVDRRQAVAGVLLGQHDPVGALDHVPSRR